MGASPHEVAVVAASGVVALEPALELRVEVDQAVEALAVEGGTAELVEGDALEALAHGVVVRRTGRGPVMGDAPGAHGGAEREAELRAVVGDFVVPVVAPSRRPLWIARRRGDCSSSLSSFLRLRACRS